MWAGAANTHLQRLDRVQHKMLVWLATQSIKPSHNLDYHQLLSHFCVKSIRTRLLQRDLTYIHSVVSGRVKSGDIMRMFGLCVPSRRTRGRAILHEPTARVETVRAGMFCRLPRRINEMRRSMAGADLFASRETFMTFLGHFLNSVI